MRLMQMAKSMEYTNENNNFENRNGKSTTDLMI